MPRRDNLFKGFLFLIINLLLLGSAFAIEDIGPRRNMFRIDNIDVVGIKKVEKEAILEKINVKPGMMLDNYVLKKDIEKIYSLKYFEFVEAHQKKRAGKNTLIFKVKEKPIVNKIILEGNEEIDEEDLVSQMKTKEFAILDVNTLQLDVSAIQKHYEEKGFYLATVNYKIEKVNSENINVIFKIREYDKVRVKQVVFLGNKAFSNTQLKDIMETREESLFSFMSGSGNFKEFNFQTDIERLKYFYKTKGYLQVNVGNPEITVSDDKKWVFITVKVTEGPQFTVNEVSFQGEILFPEDELRKEIRMKEETTYSEELLRKDIQKLTEMYQDEGYAFANVLRTLHVVPGENKVDVEFSFEKGKMAYFGKIVVKGNAKTRDKVVRRELRIKEGARFSGSDLRRSRENVNRLGFFEPNSVVFNTISPKGKDDVLDVEINVKERNTGQISLGAGYSTATGGFLQASIAQTNFRGMGQNLSFSLSLSSSNKTYNLGFTEPYLFDSKWTAGFDIFRQQNETSESFSYRKDGFALRVGYPIFDYTRLFLTYKLEDTEIKAVNDPSVVEAVENGIASSVKTSVVRDKRDNRMEPKNGYYLSFSTEYAGVGGDKKWWKNDFDARYFKNFYGDFVFRSRWYTSKLEKMNGQSIPRTEKFTLGGARNLRGFSFEAIGPKTTGTKNGVTRTYNSGSLFASYGSLEIEHPLAREAGLKWVIFMDAGDAQAIDNYDIFLDWGFGFRWFSPIGVLRFEFGYPLNHKSSNPGSQFHFDIGQLF